MTVTPPTEPSEMRLFSAVSLKIDSSAALRQALDRIDEQLGADRAGVSLVMLFATGHHLAAFPDFATALVAGFPGAVVLGCSAQGVIGAGREVERREGLSLMVGKLPGCTVSPIRLAGTAKPDENWALQLAQGDVAPTQLVLLPEPFSCNIEAVLKVLGDSYPGAQVTGGLISGAEAPFESSLIIGGEVFHDGLVGIAITGPVAVASLHAQSCRPVGEAMIVTQVRDKVVHELNVGRPAEALRKLYKDLSPREQQLCHTALFLGVERRSAVKSVTKSEFLVTDILGMEPNSGAMAIGRNLKPYQVVQYHVCDAETADGNLQARLADISAAQAANVRGVLLFTNTGRGERLFGEADHDAARFRRRFRGAAVAGFFSSGEIGPLAETSQLHGHTVVATMIGAPAVAEGES